eukprot:UN05391
MINLNNKKGPVLVIVGVRVVMMTVRMGMILIFHTKRT